MTDIRRMLSPEERAEYDALIEEAYLDSKGNPRTPREYGERALASMRDADQAGRPWAAWYMDAWLVAGAKSAVNKWSRANLVVRVRDQDRLVNRGRMASLKRVTESSDGAERVEHQDVMYEDLTADDVEAIVHASRERIRDLRVTLAVHLVLQDLMLRNADAATVGEALRAEGVTLQDLLDADEAA